MDFSPLSAQLKRKLALWYKASSETEFVEYLGKAEFAAEFWKYQTTFRVALTLVGMGWQASM